MGYNTAIIVRNDSLDAIEKDPEFGKKIGDAISRVQRGEQIDITATPPNGGYHCNAATVIETHHADSTVVIAMGGNYATVLGTHYSYRHHTPEDRIRILETLLEEERREQQRQTA